MIRKLLALFLVGLLVWIVASLPPLVRVVVIVWALLGTGLACLLGRMMSAKTPPYDHD